jgi:hypothetical protein
MHKSKKILSPEFRYVLCVYLSISTLLKASYLLFHFIELHPWWNDNPAKHQHAVTLLYEAFGFAIIACIAWYLRTNAYESLTEDFALLVRRCPSARTEINRLANCIGNPTFDQEEAKRCLAFAEKYGIRNP